VKSLRSQLASTKTELDKANDACGRYVLKYTKLKGQVGELKGQLEALQGAGGAEEVQDLRGQTADIIMLRK
jgi:phage shock protein A